jgi:SAM-dependent methyltransferase
MRKECLGMKIEFSRYPVNDLLSSEQLDPRLYQMDYSMRRYFVDEFYTRYVGKLPQGLQWLDVGGQRDNKRGQFDIHRYDLKVLYLNLSANKGTDIVGDAANLPYADASMDGVICGELLEHVPEPRYVVRELQRVLKPEGIALITVPFLYRIHADPYDFGRYTDYFWFQVLQEAGFHEIVIEKQGLFGAVLFDMLRDYIHREGWMQGRWRKWLRPLIVSLRRYAMKWDAKIQSAHHPIYTSYTTGFGIYARRK